MSSSVNWENILESYIYQIIKKIKRITLNHTQQLQEFFTPIIQTLITICRLFSVRLASILHPFLKQLLVLFQNQILPKDDVSLQITFSVPNLQSKNASNKQISFATLDLWIYFQILFNSSVMKPHENVCNVKKHGSHRLKKPNFTYLVKAGGDQTFPQHFANTCQICDRLLPHGLRDEVSMFLRGAGHFASGNATGRNTIFVLEMTDVNRNGLLFETNSTYLWSLWNDECDCSALYGYQ